MVKLLLFLIALTPLFAAGKADKPAAPTFAKDIAAIFHKRCAECHRAGEIAPMSLLTYQETRPWAASIREKVLDRSMPPWLADPKYGHFSNDRRLPQSEIDAIVAWVNAGAPKGDDKDLPAAPKFEQGWVIGKPDAVVSMAAEFDVPAEGAVPYKNFIVPTNFTEDKWVHAAEIRPGNRKVVHHIIVYIREPEPGPTVTGPVVVKESRDPLLVGFAPGEQPKVFRAGTARLVKAGSSFIFQVHYTPNGAAAKDRSYVGLVFAKEPVELNAQTGRALNLGFVIPPGNPNYEVKSSWTSKEDVHVSGFMPHMHLRGKDFLYTAVYPDGRREEILSVPKYDFNWQLVYVLQEPLALPKGARIDCVAHFDNSPNNKFNPDPAKEVKWGPQTWDEMMIGWFDYTADSCGAACQAARRLPTAAQDTILPHIL